jgi:adenosylcobinamide-GDP ribazoletransferase
VGALELTQRWASRLKTDVAANLAFFTRLPIRVAGTPFNFAAIAWAAPLAGAIVGLTGAATMFIAAELGLPYFVVAALALTATIAINGAMHEDGLADVADGFGGGATREQKLAIMRDSRLGAYGAIAVALSLLLRFAALASALRFGLGFAAAAMVVSGACARAGALAPLALLKPARPDGLGANAARGLDFSHYLEAILVALAVAVVMGALSLGVTRAVFALIVGAAAAHGVAALARRQIGGQTGDVAGAAAQAAETASLIALMIWVRAR